MHALKLAAGNGEGFCNRSQLAVVLVRLHGDGDRLDERNRPRQPFEHITVLIWTSAALCGRRAGPGGRSAGWFRVSARAVGIHSDTPPRHLA